MRLGTIDLEVLDLAVGTGGTFDERDMAGSGLNRLGPGRLLDALASMKDRGMITLDQKGSFTITRRAKDILWDDGVPVRARVLRLLQIRSASMRQIVAILRVTDGEASAALEDLRRDHLAMMSPQNIDGSITRVFEILPDGSDEADRTWDEPDAPRTDAASMIADIKGMIEAAVHDEKQKSDILRRLSELSKHHIRQSA